MINISSRSNASARPTPQGFADAGAAPKALELGTVWGQCSRTRGGRSPRTRGSSGVSLQNGLSGSDFDESAGAVLALRRRCYTGTRWHYMGVHWCGTGTTLVLYWYSAKVLHKCCTGTPLVLHWYCAEMGTVLVHSLFCAGTALAPALSAAVLCGAQSTLQDHDRSTSPGCSNSVKLEPDLDDFVRILAVSEAVPNLSTFG